MDWELCSSTSWISGDPYDYGQDDAGYYASHRNHVLVREFEMDASEVDLARSAGATLLIAPLGMCRVFLNGSEATDAALGEWTDCSDYVCYRELSVGGLLEVGTNTIAIEMGNGWYNPSPLRLFGKYNLRERLSEVGTPMVACELRIDKTNETIVASDASWGWHEGQLLFNNVYLGEDRDLASPGPTSPVSLRPVTATQKARRLVAALHPACRKAAAVPVEEVREVVLSDGKTALLADAGEMVTGVARVSGFSELGDVWELTYAEALGEDGLPCLDSNLAGLVGLPIPGTDPKEGRLIDGGPGAPRVAAERDVVRCAQGRSVFEGSFSLHSFRYILIRGLRLENLEKIVCFPVHTDLDEAGSLSCGVSLFDRMADAAMRTKLNNVHGIWEDCARERLGYGGDMVALCDSNLLAFDCEALVRKTVRDFRSGQTARGGVPETAPFMGIQSNGTAEGEGPLLWQLAYPYLVLKAQQYYGARDLLDEEWPYLRKQADYLLGEDWAWLSSRCLGDHGSVCTGESWKSGTPDKEFVGWCAILWIARTVKELARRKGDADAEASYACAAEALAAQISERFVADGHVASDTQTAWAFAGGLEIVDVAAAGDELARRVVEADGVLETGIFGTKLAFELLHKTDHDDVVESWLLRREWPSFGAMLSDGSGALAEQFEKGVLGLGSCNHAMFSSYLQWLYQALAGLSVAEDSDGADHIAIAPYFSPYGDGASASYRSSLGTTRVSWRRGREGEVVLEAAWPEGVRAEIATPRGWVAAEAVSNPGFRFVTYVADETKK